MRNNILRILLGVWCMVLSTLTAKAEVGDWTVYGAYHDATRVVELGGKVYTLSSGNLFCYDPEDEMVATYSKATHISDFEICDMELCEDLKCIVMLYSNGNIDVLRADNTVTNMPSLKQKSLKDKQINRVQVYGKYAYVCTNSGVAEIDLTTCTFMGMYDLGHKVYTALRTDKALLLGTSGGVFTCPLNGNKLVAANWKMISTDSSIKVLTRQNGTCFATSSNSINVIISPETFSINKIYTLTREVVNCWTADATTYFRLNDGTIIATDDAATCKRIDTKEVGTVNEMCKCGKKVFAACGDKGLVTVTLAEGSIAPTSLGLTPNSPPTNYSYKLNFPSSERMLLAGGVRSIYDANVPGNVTMLDGGTWKTFDREDAIVAAKGEASYINITDVVQDPFDENHHFASSGNSGLYEFRNGKFVEHYDNTNSTLRSAIPGSSRPWHWVIVTGLQFDKAGNLWMTNNVTDSVLHIMQLRGKDGKPLAAPRWLNYSEPLIDGMITYDNITFDSRGWAWINSRMVNSHSQSGIFVLNTNGTIDTQKDDKTVFISSFSNQDGIVREPNEFHVAKEDLDGVMWLCTSAGLYKSETPEKVFNSGFGFQQVKITREDDETLADYLLNDVDVTCIAFDGGNRKWVGTADNGVYLLSADCKQTVHHFTSSNSPLLTDAINDIAINGSTGEVFIATASGLVSYTSDATDGEETLSGSNVKVWPNPVRPDYNGVLHVSGLMRDTMVKIVNSAGVLVGQGMSVGGSFSWNCRLSNGSRPASGVYYILGTDEDGSNGVCAKFVIVN